jgi:4-amino-4-deoxy-L-arabinose transferase-like glycosyltransferase
MAAGGDWVVPRLNGLIYLEKPPLQYWASAAIFRLLGEDEWTARLWPALTGLAGVLAVWFAGTRLFGRRAGLVAALLAASTLEYVVLAQVLTLDMGLTFFLSAAVFCFLLAQRDDIAAARRQAWMIGAWALLGLAVLSKGLIGVVLPALALAAYAAVERDVSVLKRLRPVIGIPVLLAVTLPWFVAVQSRVPQFFDFFFVREHFERFALPAHQRPGPWYSFVVMFVVGALPWTLVYLGAWRRGLSAAPAAGRRFDPARFLAVYALVVLVFFSASQSKLPAYILPLYPPLALLGGLALANGGKRAAAQATAALLAFGVLIALAAAVLPDVPRLAGVADQVRQYRPCAFAAAALAGAGALLAYGQLLRRRRLRALAAAALGGLLAQLLLINGAQVFAAHHSTEGLVRAAQLRTGGILDPTAPFYSVQLYDQTLPLHLRRTVTLVDYRDELDLGLRLEPDAGLPDLQAFRRAWSGADRGYAVMRHERHAAERAAGLPMIELARDARYVIVARDAPRRSGVRPGSTVW